MSYKNATHLLRCRRAVGPSGRTYFMHCNILKKMPDGRLKVLVYGNRYWKDRRDVARIRYVTADRVSKI